MSDGANIVATVDATFQNTLDLDTAVSQSTPTLNATLSQDENLDASLSSDISELDVLLSEDQEISVDLGQYYGGGGVCKVLYNTSEYWNSHPQLMSKRGYVYVYSDYKRDKQNRDIAGIKVGDGLAYLIDMPFIDELYLEHIEDENIHITSEERNAWNEKVRCYIDPNNENKLIFTTE